VGSLHLADRIGSCGPSPRPRVLPHRPPSLHRPAHGIPLDECDLAPDDYDGGKPHVLRGREDPVGPVPQHQLHPRGRRALRGPRVPERAADAACPRDLLGRAPPHARVLRDVPVHGDNDQRRLPLARPLPVLRLLGGRPDPDVFPHRGVGRAAQEVRRDQVLHVHVPREPPAAGGHLRILLLLESAHVRHDADHRHDADPRRDDRGPDVRRPPNRVRHETPDVAVAHMAARRPCRGTHGRLRHPGRSPPEARRLRVDPLQRPDDSAGRGRYVLAPPPRRGHLDPLRRGGVAKRAPRMATFIMISFMASLGLPGLVGFVAEFTVFIGVYAAFGLLVFVPILTVVLTAAYYIWAMQRAIFGPLNPKWETMPDLHRFEVAPLAVLVASFAVFGIVPVLFLSFLSSWAQGILGGL